jgi:hypothetical protein
MEACQTFSVYNNKLLGMCQLGRSSPIGARQWGQR